MKKRAAAVVGLTVAGLVGVALPAEAATTGVVSVSSNVVIYTAATGKANTVVLTRSANTITVDDVYGIKAGAGCSAVSGDVTKIRCTPKVAAGWVRVDLGDGNDTLTNNTGLGMTAWGRTGNDKITGGSLKDDVFGGDGNDAIWGNGGNDTLRGESGADSISGGDGDDTLAGGSGNDRLLGGNGDDWLIGQQGNDVEDGGPGDDDFDEPYDLTAGTDRDAFIGGPGFDGLDYSLRQKAVTADADAVSGDDGAAGEGDTIGAEIEIIRGGNGNDRLLGTGRDDILIGGPGNDVIAGGSGDDILQGDLGQDYFNGAGGLDDCIDPEPGETVLNCEDAAYGSASSHRGRVPSAKLHDQKFEQTQEVS